jgi:hypothetical protein
VISSLPSQSSKAARRSRTRHLCGDTYLCEDREKGGVGEIPVGAKVLKMSAEPCLSRRTMTPGIERQVQGELSLSVPLRRLRTTSRALGIFCRLTRTILYNNGLILRWVFKTKPIQPVNNQPLHFQFELRLYDH